MMSLPFDSLSKADAAAAGHPVAGGFALSPQNGPQPLPHGFIGTALEVVPGRCPKERGEIAVFLEYPQMKGFAWSKKGSAWVDCPFSELRRTGISMSWDDANPPTWFFDTAARAGSIITRAKEDVTRQNVVACWQDALRSEYKNSLKTVSGIRYQCYEALPFKGGVETTIKIDIPVDWAIAK